MKKGGGSLLNLIVFSLLFSIVLTPFISAPFGFDNLNLPSLRPIDKTFIGNFSFDGLCINGGVEIRNGTICGQRLEILNITNLNVTKQNLTITNILNVLGNVTAEIYFGERVRLVGTDKFTTLSVKNFNIVSQSLMEFFAPVSVSVDTGKVFSIKEEGSGFATAIFYSDGKYCIGGGSATRDVCLSRQGVNEFLISNDGIRGSADLNITGKLFLGSDILLSDEDFIVTNTSDGLDDQSIGIAGGGSLSNLRGSFVRVSGNEDTNTGKLFLTAGNIAGGIIRLSTGGSTRLDIDEVGNFTFDSGTFFIDSINNFLGKGTLRPLKDFHISSTVPTIRLSDSDAGSDQAVATLIEFYRGDNTNRVGFWGMASASNDVMVLATDYADGEISIRTGNNIERLNISSSGDFDFQSGDLITTGKISSNSLFVINTAPNLTFTDVTANAVNYSIKVDGDDMTISPDAQAIGQILNLDSQMTWMKNLANPVGTINLVDFSPTYATNNDFVTLINVEPTDTMTGTSTFTALKVDGTRTGTTTGTWLSSTFRVVNTLVSERATTTQWGGRIFESAYFIEINDVTSTGSAGFGFVDWSSFFSNPTFQVRGSSGVGTQGLMIGLFSGINIKELSSGTATLKEFRDFDIVASTKSGTPTFTTRNMINVADETNALNVNFINSVLSSGANKYFINHTGTAKSFFGGNVTIDAYVNVTENATFKKDVIIDGTLFGGSLVKIAGINITNNNFTFTDNLNSSLRFFLKNINSSENATTVISTRNDAGGSMSIGIGSSNFVLGDLIRPNMTALFSRARGEMAFINAFNTPFVWYNNPSDDNLLVNLIEVMRLTKDGLNVSGNITSTNVFIPQYHFAHTNETIKLNSANVWQNVTFTEEVTDIQQGISHTHSDNTNQTFTVSKSGIYKITYHYDLIDTSGSSTDINVAGRLVFVNGSEIAGSVFEIDILKKDIEVELVNTFLVSLIANEGVIFQFIADDVDVQISTHKDFGDNPESATIIIQKIANR